QISLQPSPVLNSDFNYHKRQNSFDIGYIRQNESKFYIKANRYSDRNEVLTGVSVLDFAPLDTLGFVTTNDIQQLVSVYSDSTVAFKPFLSFGLVNTHRIFNYEVNSFNSTAENQEYKGVIIPVRAELRVLNEPTTRVDIGLSYQKEAMLYEEFKQLQADKSNEMTGVFTKVEHDLSENISATAGVRQDKDLNFNSVTTYQAGIDFGGYKLEYATGYRLPSLYQLYSNKGNGNLSPEFARTYTLSRDFKLSENLRASLTFFETHIENQITSRTDPSTGLLKYYNNRTITKGVEGGVGLQISSDDYLKASYAYQEPRDINSGRWLTKRPLHSASVGYLKQLNHQSINVEFVGRGERQDQKNGFTYVRLPGFGIVNISYDYEISSALEVFARANNLLATQYEESYGYYIRGSDWQVGLTSQF
ncbi:MAG: TonB-dependent receptor, partial [Bdellovibrionaceae bacterium]|nr:TonB-dependent receptor [Pseudobdellovibrionaceae bacterium]